MDNKPSLNFTFFVTSANLGGAQVFCIRLASLLVSKGHVCHLVSGPAYNFSNCFASADTHFASHLIIKKLSNKSSFLNDIFAFFSVFTTILSSRHHVIITNSGKISSFVRLSCLLLFKPCFFVVHGWSYTGWRFRPLRLIYLFFEFILEFIDIPFCTKIFVSHFDRIHRPIPLLNFLGHDSVVHNDCIDFSSIPAAPPPHGIRPASLNIFSIARFSRQKNFDDLLLAIARRPNYSLYLIGDGPDFQNVKNQASSLGIQDRIIFLGELSPLEILSYAHFFDIFVLVSFWEGFPISTLEAMSLSKPVVVSDVGGACEVFDYAGSQPFGFPIPPVDPVPYLLKVFDNYATSPDLLDLHSINARRVFELHFGNNKKLNIVADIVLS